MIAPEKRESSSSRWQIVGIVTVGGNRAMKLRTKVIVLYACSAVLITALLGGFLYNRLWNDRLAFIQEDIAKQLGHIDFTLGVFFSELESDVNNLAANPAVRIRDDADFTSFLAADEQTFRYSVTPAEQKIIDLFKTYQATHPYVNVAYMGRENGSFVRSQKRTRPTRYDPRDRPWYLLAKNNPGRVMVTEAYPSVTNQDINIGIVKGLIDGKNRFYGVLGVDVTLAKLTDFIEHIKINPAGTILLTDSKGVILASEDHTLHYTALKSFSPELHEKITDAGGGFAPATVRGKENYAYYLTSASHGWKIIATVPVANIEKQIRGPVIATVAGLSAGFFLITVFTLLGLNIMIVAPLHRLARETRYIAETSDLDRRVEEHSRDELGMLAVSFNEMIQSLDRTKRSLEAAGEELKHHRDHLEELVAKRTAMLQEANSDLSREITERAKREEELKRTMEELVIARKHAEVADNLKSAFLATMSHELRTPLNSIIGFTGIILRERVGPLNDEQKKQLGMVQRSSQHLLSLINDVLDISKIEAGQLKMFLEPTDIRQIVEKVALSMRPAVEGKGLALEVSIQPDVASAPGDARRIEQVLLNLLSNAVKFTEEDAITIVCEDNGQEVAVRITDTGIGIKEEDTDKVFASFRQIDSGLTRKYEGTGLGLSISKKLVELMGGRLWMVSAWGEGSTFAFALPKERKAP
jgi:signal transduction histidine kinase